MWGPGGGCSLVLFVPSFCTFINYCRINYWLVQAILAADVVNSVVRAHDMRKFAFSINWARRADMSHIIKHGFWSSVHPFLNNYLTPLEGPFPECIAAGSRVWFVPSHSSFIIMGCNRGEGEDKILCFIPWFWLHTCTIHVLFNTMYLCI